jgi:uncharacterized repeat protein (TIGR04076 family)
MIYKVVATVHKVSKPAPVPPAESAHVLYPCRLYKEGDKIVIEDNQLNLAETTGAICLALFASMIPVLKGLQREVEPERDQKTHAALSDSTQRVAWFACPDAERPVLFKIERIPQKGRPGWVIAEEMVLKNPGMTLHLHTPNPNDRLMGIHDNLAEEIEDYGK